MALRARINTRGPTEEMSDVMMKIGRLFTLVTTLAVLLIASAGAAIADTVYLADGTTVVGDIVREGDSFIYIEVKVGGVTHTRLIPRSQIDRIEQDKPVEVKPRETRPRARQESAETADQTPETAPGSATRIAFITLEDEVGTSMNAAALSHSIDLLESEDVDIVVLRVNSGGGALLEVQKLSDVIQNDIKPKYRVVGWIESAISAAAMTIWTCEELYMMDEGNIGAATAFMQDSSGRTHAAKGEQLEQILRGAQELSRRGKRNPMILHAMQEFMTLSCDIDEETGDITWHDDNSGQYIVSPENRILTFNSRDAVKYKIAMGVANTKKELAKQMGLTEWVEVGLQADEYQQKFRENVAKAQVQIRAARAKMENAISAGNFSRARRHLEEIRSWVRKAPSLEIYAGLSKEWFREQKRRIRKAREGASNRRR